jgi:hypothetical protein
VLFTFPSRYWFTIGRLVILRLTEWSPQIHAGLLGPGATWDGAQSPLRFDIRGFYPLWPTFPGSSSTSRISYSVLDLKLQLAVPLPRVSNAFRLDTDTVWPLPSSLAATKGVAVAFSSSGYSDVSIPLVPSTGAMCSRRSNTPQRVLCSHIRTSTDQPLFDGSPWLFAVNHVLHRS